ncbi:hypothetical protein [Burkholderia phage FLC9]|nr:hypothetical protein [Burkholderia phage FLC9]
MPYYRNTDGAVVYFASIAFINELPPGSVVLTDEEAAADLPTPLNIAREQQVATLNAAWQAATQSGFVSSALGAPYTYPSTLEDQANLSSSVIASMLPSLPSTWTTLFKCTSTSGATSLRAHTAAQIQKVGLDGMARIEKCTYQLNVLEAQVANAGTPEDVAKIVWTDPT